ncbi:hypothetical protein CW751_00240 [Brumimicrobium salinarum]|uniref:FAD/NAD(P)-binding domain-containing protein n=1 Tax=Brumimicrobium salinarum TaxID=2058658 RepID=A0A2I0R5E6_9FLAO|nr:hypothetical protein CW751_00240 [Brumimicrobium salinarum]
MEHVVIIGNGIAGVTAARHIRKNSDKRITIISSESKYFFSRTALMYVYMRHMRFEDIQPYENDFWQKNRIDLIEDYVDEVNFEHKTLNLLQTPPIQYDQLILATGSQPNKFGWKGKITKFHVSRRCDCSCNGWFNVDQLFWKQFPSFWNQ